jgi:hypothetical protein
MRPGVGRPQFSRGRTELQVRNAAKDRLIVIGAVFATLPLAISSVPWTHKTAERLLDLCPRAHVTLEASLNMLWVVLAVGAFTHWTAPGSRLAWRSSGLISLVFVLALLFPVISADDDLARLDLINDAKTSQAITLDLKSHSQPATSAVLLNPPALLASAFVVSLFPHFELVFEPARGLSVATPGATTGNHSPPLC